MPTLTEPKIKAPEPAKASVSELAQWETFVGKTFTKREGNPDRTVYKVIHICPQFTGTIPERQKIDRFYVQKYAVSYAAGGRIETAIDDPEDSESAFYIDASEFVKVFKQE